MVAMAIIVKLKRKPKVMKKYLFTLILLQILHLFGFGQSLLVDDFTGYSIGNLAGQGGWTKYGGGPEPTVQNTTPITYINYNGGGAEYITMPSPSATTSKVYKALTSTPVPTSNTFFYSLLVKISATSTSSSNYFISLGDPTSGTAYFAKFFAQTNATGFSLGISKTSNTAMYGTTLLNYNQTYLVVVRYDFIAGSTSNDQVALWINPDITTEPLITSAEVLSTSGTDANPATVGNFHWHNRGLSNPVGSFDGIRVAYGATSAQAWANLNAYSGGSTPTLTVNPATLSGFTYIQGSGPSGEQSFSISGTGLTSDITITPPTNYEISASSGPFNPVSPLTLTPTGGTVNSTTVYVRLKAGLAANTYNGEMILASSAGASTMTVTCNGTVTSAASPPTMDSPTTAAITNNSAVLGGTITNDGGAAILERGTVWNNAPGVTIADNKLAEGGTAVGAFSHSRTGLPAKTQIYFKAYATNSAGTGLTSETSFFTLADEPANHVTGFAAVSGGTTTITLSWTAAATGADGYLILQKAGTATPTATPADATGYTAGSTLGDATVAAIVTSGSALSQTISGLTPGTAYSFTIFPFAWDGTNAPTYNYHTAAPVPGATSTTPLPPVTTYTWTGSVSTDFAVADNWTPSRTTPATNDILHFDNAGTVTVTNVTTQGIGQLGLSNNSTVTFQSTSAAVITINGGTGTDLQIPAGCALNFYSTLSANTITIALGTGSTGSISGSMTFSATASTAHRLTAADVGAIIFTSGSTFLAGSNFNGNAFGTSKAGSVIFSEGATYVHQAGSNPFVNNAPNSIVVFQTGSLYKLVGNTTPSFSGKIYANFELDLPGVIITTTGGSSVSIDDLTITQGTLNFNMTATPGHSIKGNIHVNAGGTLNFSPSSAGTVSLNGSALQAISGTGTITTSANSTIEINNANGVSLSNNLTMNGHLKLTNGLLTLGSGNLALGTTSTISGTPSSGAMIVATGTGQLTKGFASAGSFTFPVGDNTGTPEYSPVTLNFTSGTFGTGNFAGVSLVNAKYPSDPNTTHYLNRYWTVTTNAITGFTCDAAFDYVPADVTGTEADIFCVKVNPAPYVAYNLADAVLHRLTATGLNYFSTFTGTRAAPVATTLPATSVTETSASLNGAVVANNLDAAVVFEFGLTTAYGFTLQAVPSTVTGTTVTAVQAAATGLTPNTTYHFRVKGTNAAGTSNGEDLTFTTLCPLPATPGAISGPTSVCAGGSGYVYTVAPIANATGYVWSLPSGASITSGANTNSITVAYALPALSGNITVYGTNLCGDGPASSPLPVTVNALPVPVIGGSNPVCFGASDAFYFTETGMTNYQWTVSAGGLIIDGAGTSFIQVAWFIPGPQWVSVGYTNAAGCTCANPTVFNVTYLEPFMAGSISADQTICHETAPSPLTGTPPTGGSMPYLYQWELSTNGVNFTEISYATNLTYQPAILMQTTYYRMKQTSSASCGSLYTNVVTINVYEAFQPGTIASSQTIGYNTVPDPLTSTPPSGGVGPFGYQWQVSNDGSTFADINGATGTGYAPGALTTTTYYRLAQASSQNCGFEFTNIVTITVNPQPYLVVTSPDGGENWLQGSSHAITWVTNVTSLVKIDLYKGGVFHHTIEAGAPGTGTYTWNISAGLTTGSDYRVVITSVANPSATDQSNADFTISGPVPPTLTVQGVTVNPGETACYNATGTITVAGGSTTFLVQNGGSATFIAGQNILFMPGTTVEPGGMMHAYIAPDGPFCPAAPPQTKTGEVVKVTVTEEPDLQVSVYPNPTEGRFFVELSGDQLPAVVSVEVIDLRGNSVLRGEMRDTRKQEFDLSGIAMGVYGVRITSGDWTRLVRIVRL